MELPSSSTAVSTTRTPSTLPPWRPATPSPCLSAGTKPWPGPTETSPAPSTRFPAWCPPWPSRSRRAVETSASVPALELSSLTSPTTARGLLSLRFWSTPTPTDTTPTHTSSLPSSPSLSRLMWPPPICPSPCLSEDTRPRPETTETSRALSTRSPDWSQPPLSSSRRTATAELSPSAPAPSSPTPSARGRPMLTPPLSTPPLATTTLLPTEVTTPTLVSTPESTTVKQSKRKSCQLNDF